MRAAVRTKKFTPKPANPQADPRFKNVKNKVGQKSVELKKHPPAKQKSNEAAKAAKGPPNEKASGAKAKQVDTLKETKAETPPADSFLTVLRAEIEKVMPSNLEDSTEFMDGGAESEMKGAVGGNVKDQKETASGDLNKASKAPPNEGGVPAKSVEAVPPDPNVPVSPVNGGGGMPAPKPEAEITEKQTKADAQTAIKENRLEGKRLQNKDKRFETVKAEKGNVDKTADASPNKYRAGEKQTLGKAAAQANVTARTGMTALTSVKNKSKSAVSSRQDAQKKKDEDRRKEVTTNIENIYKDTKLKVDTNLNSLERDVMAIFDAGSSSVINSFKSNTKREIERFKDDRYSGISGKAQWVIDKFKDTPPEIKRIIQSNLKTFTAAMDALAVRVAGLVDKRLNKAKADIDGGQAKIKAYVASLPKDLKAVGQEAEKAMESRFNEMRDGVESQKNSLAQKLAEKYKAAHDQANELAKQIEEENKGAFKKLADAIGEVIKIILEFKAKLMALLKKAADAIELILDDPIGFLGNLISAIKQGVNQFVGNIWTHLKAGFMKWLFGSLADAGIEIPSDLSLVSLFKMVMSVLGLTIPRMRAKAVKLLGPTAVAVIEKLIEYVSALITGGPAKLWEQVKADVGDLKAMIIDAIQSWLIDTIIKQATIKLLSFFNPAGAFVQAVIAIYNTVMFIVENAAKIMAFVEAVINSISSIASGAIGAAASWIEKSLASMIPLLIGFLARLIGLGGLSKKVKEFITKVQGKVDKAIDKAIAKIVQVVRKLFGKGKSPKDDKDKEKKVEAGLKQLENDSRRALDEGELSRTDAEKIASKVKAQHPVFKSVTVTDGGADWVYDYVASPGKKKKAGKKAKASKSAKKNVKSAGKSSGAAAKGASNGSKAFKSGKDRERRRRRELIEKAEKNNGICLQAKATGKTEGPGFDVVILTTMIDENGKKIDVLQLIEIKAGKSPRAVKSRASDRDVPLSPSGKPKTEVKVPNTRGAAAKMIAQSKTLTRQIVQGKTALVQNGRVIQNQLSAITENLQSNIDKVREFLNKAIEDKDLQPSVRTRLNKILSGQGGRIQFIVDVKKGASMSEDQAKAAEALIGVAFEELMKGAKGDKTELETVIP